MAKVLWDAQGILFVVFLEGQRMITYAVYDSVLRKLAKALTGEKKVPWKASLESLSFFPLTMLLLIPLTKQGSVCESTDAILLGFHLTTLIWLLLTFCFFNE